jgi:hypothetical protein
VKQIYKGHEIIIKSIKVGRDQWDLNIGILWTENQRTTVRPCTIRRLFKTCQEAEDYGLALVKNWIDEGKPTPPLKRGVGEIV